LPISVIDIFAGPGGLGEGFSALLNEGKARAFKIALSIEKEPYAHQTLTLRSFFRQFEPDEVPAEYYEFVKGKISLQNLYKSYPEQAKAAKEEAWLAELGVSKDSVSNKEVDERIIHALNGETNWLLVGGPPCQAYSNIGRSRRKEKLLDGKKDHRVELYKQYLRILAIHNPAIFVMENVKGLLSAETKESPVFSRILEDLSDPVSAYNAEFKQNGVQLICPGYKIYSLVVPPEKIDEKGKPIFHQKDFIIHAERFGIPQTRHRVILLGVRHDIDTIPSLIDQMNEVPVSKVISGLPRLRSALSRVKDTNEAWGKAVRGILKGGALTGIDKEVKDEIYKQVDKIKSLDCKTGSNYLPYSKVDVNYRRDWYLDENLAGVCNHQARGHMESDLLRYFFVSCFGKAKGVSPKLHDFPFALLPDHENVQAAINEKKFADRFRVQLNNKPSKTITSHISKDGHYYIHPNPTQCRSFTVREAARIQTFPDNYYFCGPRTSQFTQVGNAVPPLLANKIAYIVFKVLAPILNRKALNIPVVSRTFEESKKSEARS
jgi:DNA (cytosine-5)-methyltransferase 1